MGECVGNVTKLNVRVFVTQRVYCVGRFVGTLGRYGCLELVGLLAFCGIRAAH